MSKFIMGVGAALTLIGAFCGLPKLIIDRHKSVLERIPWVMIIGIVFFASQVVCLFLTEH